MAHRTSVRWLGWIRDLKLPAPWHWVCVVASGRETLDRCKEALDRLHPPDEEAFSAGSVDKAYCPVGSTPTKGQLPVPSDWNWLRKTR